MAITEVNSLVRLKDENGNEFIAYPISKGENITYDNTESKMAAEDVQSAIDELAGGIDAATEEHIAVTMAAAGWDATTKIYSFESTYPFAQYDIEIQPSDTCTEDQIKAWMSAQMVGSITANAAKAYGDVPAVDIPIILTVKRKAVAGS